MCDSSAIATFTKTLSRHLQNDCIYYNILFTNDVTDEALEFLQKYLPHKTSLDIMRDIEVLLTIHRYTRFEIIVVLLKYLHERSDVTKQQSSINAENSSGSPLTLPVISIEIGESKKQPRNFVCSFDLTPARVEFAFQQTFIPQANAANAAMQNMFGRHIYADFRLNHCDNYEDCHKITDNLYYNPSDNKNKFYVNRSLESLYENNDLFLNHYEKCINYTAELYAAISDSTHCDLATNEKLQAYKHFFNRNSVYINDDVTRLQEIVTENPSYLDDKLTIFYGMQQGNPIDAAAANSAIRCFKFLLLNQTVNCTPTKETLLFALSSTNTTSASSATGISLEILRILQQQFYDVCFAKDNAEEIMKIALASHNFDVINWFVSLGIIENPTDAVTENFEMALVDTCNLSLLLLNNNVNAALNFVRRYGSFAELIDKSLHTPPVLQPVAPIIIAANTIVNCCDVTTLRSSANATNIYCDLRLASIMIDVILHSFNEDIACLVFDAIAEILNAAPTTMQATTATTTINNIEIVLQACCKQIFEDPVKNYADKSQYTTFIINKLQAILIERSYRNKLSDKFWQSVKLYIDFMHFINNRYGRINFNINHECSDSDDFSDYED